MKAGQAVIEALRAEGVEYTFVYGARGFYITRPDEIADAVVEALAVDGPSVIEIPVAEYFPLPAPTPGGASRH